MAETPPDVPLDPATLAAGKASLAYVAALASSNTAMHGLLVEASSRAISGRERLLEVAQEFRKWRKFDLFCVVAQFPKGCPDAVKQFETGVQDLPQAVFGGHTVFGSHKVGTSRLFLCGDGVTENWCYIRGDDSESLSFNSLGFRAWEALPVMQRALTTPIALSGNIRHWPYDSSRHWLQWVFNVLEEIPGCVQRRLDADPPHVWLTQGLYQSSMDAIDVFVQKQDGAVPRWADSALLAKLAGMTLAATRSKLSRIRRTLPDDAWKPLGDGREEYVYRPELTLPRLKPKMKS